MQVICQFFCPCPSPQLLSRLAYASLLLVSFLLPRYASAQDECPDWQIEIIWGVTGRKLLFVIAVRAYPGEAVLPVGMFAGFQLVTSTVDLVCEQPPVTLGTLEKTLSTLPGCGLGAVSLTIGAATSATVTGYPNAQRVPVFARSGVAVTVSSLEFLLKISSVGAPAGISIGATGILPATDVSLYLEPTTVPNSNNQRVFCSTQNFSVAGGNVNNLLFYIIINGPLLASDCEKVTVSFVGERRLQTAADCCRPILGTSEREVNFGATPCTPNYCSPNVKLKVKKVNTPAVNACSDLFFVLDIANNGTGPVSYQSGNVVLYLTHDGTLNYGTFDAVDFGFNTTSTSVTATAGSTVLLKLDFSFTAATTIALAAGVQKTLATFTLHGADVCIKSIQFFDASLRETNATKDCTPLKISTEVVDTNQLCLQNFSVYFKKQYYPLSPPSPIGIDEVTYTVKADGSTCEVTGISDSSGYDTKCLCTEQKQILSPTKDVNPLNGVSTYDLVLISRHILGLEAFGNPYKMVAADANKSRSITTFDIVEFRKLILGIYQTLPSNTSWRFIPEAFVFPNANNAFQTVFPEKAEINLPLSYPGEVPIYGIKVGDVNGNVLASLTGAGNVDRDGTKILPLGFLAPSARRGEITEIPLFVRQATDVAAWQLALRYDPARMKIKNVRWAMAAEPTPYEMADWHTPTPGELRLCWFDPTGMTTHLAALAPIAYLQVEWLGNPAKDAHAALELIGTIPGEAYGSAGQIANLALAAVSSYQAPVIVAKAVQPKPEWLVAAYPNPTGGVFRFEVSLPVGGEGRIGLYDPMGRSVTRQDISFTPGLNVITSQQFPPLSTGIYFVRFDTPMGRQTLRLVKN